MASPWDQLILPVNIWQASPGPEEPLDDELFHHPLVSVRRVSTPVLPHMPDWYPMTLSHWGISGAHETPRIWYAGRPRGFEWKAFVDAVVDRSRQRDPLSPLAKQEVGRCQSSLTLVVLTVPT